MSNTSAPIEVWYRRIGKATVGAVLFLILVGGIVRSTGSGMGCPDWPKCFGLLVPPTDVSEIPPSFFEAYPAYSSQEFNGFQTWVEYLNRLTGALIGLFAFMTAVLSIGFFRKDKRVFFLSILAMVMVGFEGWLGKLVVDQNLAGGMVTLHMLVAFLIVATLITAVYFAASHTGETAAELPKSIPAHLSWLGIGVVLVTLIQVLVGTQVREEIDLIAENGSSRDAWIDQLGLYYNVHKAIWIAVAIATVVWVRNLMQTKPGRQVKFFAVVVLVSLFAEILFGMLLSYMSLPPVLQPLHLLLASVMFAAQFAILINLLGVEQVGRRIAAKKEFEKRSLLNAD